MFKYIFGIFAISIIPFFSIQSKETNPRIDLLSKKLENLQEEKMNRILDLEKIEETYLISFESDDIPEPIQKSLSQKEEEISKLDNKIKSMIIRKVNSILKLELTKNEFLNILSKKEIDNAFSEYRYLYEKEANKEDIDFINALTQALHSISSNKIKYRSPYYEDIEKILNPEEQSEKKNN
jgi:protein-tyrosine-phosphatase